MLACVRSKFQPYSVTITDQDPAMADHIEIVVIDNGTQLNTPGLVNLSPGAPCVGGVAPVDENTIAFMVWGGNFTPPPSADDRCWNAAQVIGINFGLDFVVPCPDLMSQSASGCMVSAKTFTNTAAQCGEASARACRCGGTTQDAQERLLANVGPRCP